MISLISKSVISQSKSSGMKNICGIITLFFIPLILISCQSKPKGVISDKEMVELLADLHTARAYNQNGNPANLPDSIRNNMTAAILRSRGYTMAQFDSTINWYSANIDKYYELYDKVDKTLMARQKRSGIVQNQDLGKDNIWPYSAFAFFSPNAISDGFSFSIDGEGLQKGESLLWKMRMNSDSNTKAMLGVDYSDNTMAIVTSSTYGERNLEITLITDTAKVVKRIFGTLTVPPEIMPVWADSISLVKTPFDSLTYYKLNYQKLYHK